MFALLYGYTLGDYVRMRRLTLAGEELLSPELIWAPVLFILRKGGKNVILIEESNIERKTTMRRFLKFFARLFVLLLGLSLCISPLEGFAAYNLEYEQAVGNPLKGFMPFYSPDGADDSVPYSMEWFYIPLSALISDSGEYTVRGSSLISRRYRRAGIRRFSESISTIPDPTSAKRPCRGSYGIWV